MNEHMDDMALLRRYAECGCDEAFTTLVSRHVNYVHSVARRECAVPHQAEEITQAAFIILARKAGRLPANTILSGWLFRTVRYVARNVRRAEQRRQFREEEVARMSDHESNDDSLWEKVGPVLNDAMAALSHGDRDTITLRFFEKKTHAEMATALRTNEAAARKRLSRALDRLRTLLARRGVSVSVTALAAVLTSSSVHAAPGSLVSGIATAVANTAGSTPALVTTTLQLMAWTKLKVAGAAAIVLLLAGGATIAVKSSVPNDGPLSRTLPDGSVFSLTDMQMASRVTFRYPQRGQGESRSQGSIGLAGMDGTETFFLATMHEGGKGRINVGRLQVESDEGSVFDGIFTGGTIVASDGRFQAWRLHAFPRRGSNLTLRFFYPDLLGRWATAAVMTVPNPARGPFEQWTPGTLPLAQTNGDLVVSLVEFDSGGAQLRTRESLSAFWKNLPATHCAFTLQHSGGKATPWKVRSLQISDATGNRWKQHDLVSWAEGRPGPRLHISMLGALWESESAWDLRVELSRTNGFEPAELLTLTNVPVPQADELIELRQPHLVNELDLEVVAIAGAGAELDQPHKWLRHDGKMNLALSMHEERGHKRITLVHVRDDQGRPVPFNDRPSGEGRDWAFGIEPRPGARSLNFTFAVHESRFVEFRARPQQIGMSANRP